MRWYRCNLEKKLKLKHLIVNLYQTAYICTRKKEIFGGIAYPDSYREVRAEVMNKDIIWRDSSVG
jgi:hypothetical protein